MGSSDCGSPEAEPAFRPPLDRDELGVVGQPEQQPQVFGVLVQEGFRQHGVIIGRSVEHHDHAAPASPVAQQLFEEALEGLGVDNTG